jgi:hypothetical protein
MLQRGIKMGWNAGIGLLASLAIAWVLVFVYKWFACHCSKWLMCGVWLMRLRFCLLLCFAPALLGASILWFKFSMLDTLLLVRENSAFHDMFRITLMSYFTVGVGLSLCRRVELHGDQRFVDTKWLFAPYPPEPSKDIESKDIEPGWTWKRLTTWWLLGAIFPIIVLRMMLLGHTHQTGSIIFGFFAGLIGVNLIALLLAVVERWLLGQIARTANSGILPYEDWVLWIKPWHIGEYPVPGERLATLLFGTPRRGLSGLFRGPGYTDQQDVLLPGQAQSIILVVFSAAIYVFWYFTSLADNDWRQLSSPTGFYALLLLFLIGYFMSGLAYWLDRYGLPPVVFALIYVFVVFYGSVTDHYFEVDIVRATQQPDLLDADAADPDRKPIAEQEKRVNAYVAAATTPPDEDETFQQLYWANVLETWPFPVINNKKTLVVVTASGGGIQAAAWTAKVLTELDQKFPGLSQSVGLMSSVSGGSVGTMFYLGKRGLVEPDQQHANILFPKTEDKPPQNNPTVNEIMTASTQSSLEAVGWGLAFPDFVRVVMPMAAPNFLDRGQALESWWWNSMGTGHSDRDQMKSVTLRDLIPLIKRRQIPPVIFNATCVETGQRVYLSPIRVPVADPKLKPRKVKAANVKKLDDNSQDDKSRDEGQREVELIEAEVKQPQPDKNMSRPQELVSTPIDFLDFYDAALHKPGAPSDVIPKSNLRISTAARLSATFSYVTPVARPAPMEGFGFWAGLSRVQKGIKNKIFQTEESEELMRLNRHFCDGGYADNPGLVTAVRSIHDLLNYYREYNVTPPFHQILIIRIEPFPQSAAAHAKDNTGYMSAVHGPSAALNAMRVSTQAERGELELRLLEGVQYEYRKQMFARNEDLDKTFVAIQSVQRGLPRNNPAHELLTQIANVANRLSPTDLPAKQPKSDSKSKPELRLDSATLGQFDLQLAQTEVPVGLKPHLETARSHLAAAKKSVDQIPEDRNRVPVRSVTFRFKLYQTESKEGEILKTATPADKREKANAILEPPLTWTLTPAQIRDLDLAWKRIEKFNWNQRNDGTADTNSASEIAEWFPVPKK